MKCELGDSVFSVNSGVRQWCVLSPSFLNACINWVLGKFVDQGRCGTSVSNVKVTDLVFVDDDVLFAKSLKVMGMVLERLHEEARLMKLKIFLA